MSLFNLSYVGEQNSGESNVFSCCISTQSQRIWGRMRTEAFLAMSQSISAEYRLIFEEATEALEAEERFRDNVNYRLERIRMVVDAQRAPDPDQPITRLNPESTRFFSEEPREESE